MFLSPRPGTWTRRPRVRTNNLEVTIKHVALIAAAVAALIILPAGSASSHSPRAYGHKLTIARWHSEQEWRALDAIVRPESGWNPCSSYPGRHDCSYNGPNSCGIPQANPCPREWRGRLASTWRLQVRWLIRYVTSRYGSPSGALAFRQTHGWY